MPVVMISLEQWGQCRSSVISRFREGIGKPWYRARFGAIRGRGSRLNYSTDRSGSKDIPWGLKRESFCELYGTAEQFAKEGRHFSQIGPGTLRAGKHGTESY
jgi:hypothetical protein